MLDEPKVLTESQAWVDAVCSVCGWDYRLKSNAGRAARLGKELRAAGGTVIELVEYYGQADCRSVWWWFRDDWRGRKGQRPGPAQIAETWGVWTLPIAVAPPPYANAQGRQSGAGALLAYAQELRRGDRNGTD